MSKPVVQIEPAAAADADAIWDIYSEAQSIGFGESYCQYVVYGTPPEAFQSVSQGFIDAHIMYRRL